MGLITLEAMKSGKPVLTVSDAGGVTEFVRDGINGRVVAPDAESLAIAIDAMMADAATANDMGDAARATGDDVSWKRTVDALLAPADRVNRGLPTNRRRRSQRTRPTRGASEAGGRGAAHGSWCSTPSASFRRTRAARNGSSSCIRRCPATPTSRCSIWARTGAAPNCASSARIIARYGFRRSALSGGRCGAARALLKTVGHRHRGAAARARNPDARVRAEGAGGDGRCRGREPRVPRPADRPPLERANSGTTRTTSKPT